MVDMTPTAIDLGPLNHCTPLSGRRASYPSRSWSNNPSIFLATASCHTNTTHRYGMPSQHDMETTVVAENTTSGAPSHPTHDLTSAAAPWSYTDLIRCNGKMLSCPFVVIVAARPMPTS